MRKILILLSLASAFVLIADSVSARPRGMRASRAVSQPVATSKYHRTRTRAARKQQDSGPPPRHWRVALPKRAIRAALDRAAESNGAAAAAETAGAEAPHVAAAGAAPEKPQAVDGTTDAGKPAAARPAVTPTGPRKPARMVVLNPDPPRRPKASEPRVPHHFAVCYFDQAGRCVAR